MSECVRIHVLACMLCVNGKTQLCLTANSSSLAHALAHTSRETSSYAHTGPSRRTKTSCKIWDSRRSCALGYAFRKVITCFQLSSAVFTNPSHCDGRIEGLTFENMPQLDGEVLDEVKLGHASHVGTMSALRMFVRR